jgi:hypothetical protein
MFYASIYLTALAAAQANDLAVLLQLGDKLITLLHDVVVSRKRVSHVLDNVVEFTKTYCLFLSSGLCVSITPFTRSIVQGSLWLAMKGARSLSSHATLTPNELAMLSKPTTL